MTTSLGWLSLVVFFSTAGCAGVGDGVDIGGSDKPHSLILSTECGDVQEEVVVLDSDEALEQVSPVDVENLVQEEVVHLDSDAALEQEEPIAAVGQEEVVHLTCDSVIEQV